MSLFRVAVMSLVRICEEFGVMFGLLLQIPSWTSAERCLSSLVTPERGILFFQKIANTR